MVFTRESFCNTLGGMDLGYRSEMCNDVLEAPSERVKREGIYNFTNRQVLKSASQPHRAWEVFLCAQARC